MDCINLLAFIQIAITFDFGLLLLKDTHIFKDFHNSLLSEMEARAASTRFEGENLVKGTLNRNFNYRIKKEKINSNLKKLATLVDPNQAIWSKYTYLGLFSGIYGLISLLCIGLLGTSFDFILQNFLLILAQVTLFFETLAIIQFYKILDNSISYYRLVRNTIVWGVIIVGIFIFSVLGWFLKIYSTFMLPFIACTIVIVSLPIFIYVFKMVQLIVIINTTIKKSKKAIQDLAILGGKI